MHTQDSINNSGHAYERIDELQHREDVEAGPAEARTHQALVAHLAANVTTPYHED